MDRKWMVILAGLCVLLTACGRGGGEKAQSVLRIQ